MHQSRISFVSKFFFLNDPCSPLKLPVFLYTASLVSDCAYFSFVKLVFYFIPQDYLNSDSAFARSTVVTAVKFTISDHVRKLLITSYYLACVRNALKASPVALMKQVGVRWTSLTLPFCAAKLSTNFREYLERTYSKKISLYICTAKLSTNVREYLERTYSKKISLYICVKHNLETWLFGKVHFYFGVLNKKTWFVYLYCVYDLGTKARSWFLSLFIQPQPIDSQLRGCIGDFLRTVQDPDLVCSTCSFWFSNGLKPLCFTLQCGESSLNLLCFVCFTQNVRRVALVTFNSAAHNKPSLIRDLLEQILPRLYNETKVRVG